VKEHSEKAQAMDYLAGMLEELEEKGARRLDDDLQACTVGVKGHLR
jgi:hypothetical protein